MTRERMAMAGFGESLLSLGGMLGREVINQLVRSEFSSGKAALQREENRFFERAVDDPEYEKLVEKYGNESKKWQEEILAGYKTPGARNALKNMITANAPQMEAMLNGIVKGKAQDDARRKVLAAIQGTDDEPGFIPSAGATPDELHLGIVNAEAAMQRAVDSRLYSMDQAEEILIFSLMKDWPEVALNKIEASSLEPQRKLQLKSNAKTVIRNIENKRRIIEQETWDKTEAEAFNLNFDNELTPEWIREQFNLGNMNTQDRDAYLSLLARPKEVPLNWGVYDKLSEMIKEYEREEITKDKVRLAITNALGKDIPEDAAKNLRGKLDTIDKPDDPMNRSDVKRGLRLFDDLESYDIQRIKEGNLSKEEQELEESELIKKTHLSYLKKKNEYEKWIKEQEKLIDKAIEDKIDGMIQIEAEEKVKTWIDRILNPLGYKKGTAFSRMADYIKREPKAGEEDLSKLTDEELEAIIRGK